MYLVPVFLCLFASLCHGKKEMEIDLKDKITLVTGAAKGIGRAIAENFLKEEVKVVIIVDKNRTQGLVTESELKCKYGAKRVWFTYGDVTTDLDRVFEKMSKRYKYLDILVNNAGIANEDDPELTLMTNLVAPAVWTQKFYNIMRKDKGGKGGIIINIASIEAYTWVPFVRFYSASKSGLLGLSVSYGHEWNYMSSHVKVCALCPSYTETDLINQQGGLGDETELETLGNFLLELPRQSADAVGQATVTLCKTGKTGTVYTIEGGVLSVSPAKEYITVEYLRSLQ